MVIGIDEVGRGCWAGPLVAAAVGFPTKVVIPGLNDSKLLSASKRHSLTKHITDATNVIGIGWVWPREINEIGLSQSVRLAMQRAVAEVSMKTVDEVIIDGNINYLDLANSKAVIKADATIAEVSAASIIAKVARDQYMTQLAKKYPLYSFDKHVGYGTKAHLEALKLHGVLQTVHRLNYKPIQQLLQ